MITSQEIQSAQNPEYPGSVQENPIVRLSKRAREYVKTRGAIDFTIGQMSAHRAPENFLVDSANALLGGRTDYEPGLQDLKEALANLTNTTHGLNLLPHQFRITSGVRPAITSVYLAHTKPGDVVVVPVPSFSSSLYANLFNRQYRPIHTTIENGFQPSLEQLAKHVNDAKMIDLCSPLNPTGVIIPEQTLEGLAEVVVSENKTRATGEELIVLFDEVYCYLLNDKNQVRHFHPTAVNPEMKNYVITVGGMTKQFASANLGWAYGHESLMKKLDASLTNIGAWADYDKQYGAARFFSDHNSVFDYLNGLRRDVNDKLRVLENELGNLNNVRVISPDAGIYVCFITNVIGKTTPQNKLLKTAEDICDYLLDEGNVGVIPASAMGARPDLELFRASVGAVSGLEEVREGARRIVEALNRLK